MGTVRESSQLALSIKIVVHILTLPVAVTSKSFFEFKRDVSLRK